MNIFPQKNYDVILMKDYSISKEQLILNTEISADASTKKINKAFIGSITNSGFELVTSTMGYGMLCVFSGHFENKRGIIKIRTHRTYKIMIVGGQFLYFLCLSYMALNSCFDDIYDYILMLILNSLLLFYILPRVLMNFGSFMGMKSLKRHLKIKQFTTKAKMHAQPT